MANHFKPFNDLTPEEKQTVIQKQQHAKEAKKLRRAALDDLKPSDPKPSGPYPTRIQKDEYFSACPEGLCCDPFLKAGESYVDLILLHTLTTKNLIDYNYFMFCGSDEEVWDKTLFVKLAFEGFFTITIPNEHIRPGKLLSNEPLAELQPFYSVIDWQNFEATKHVKGTLKRLRKIQHVRYRLRSSHDGTLVWNAIQHYHSSKHGCNWLTKEYLDAMTRAHEDSSLNFRMHAIELYEEAGGSSQLVAGEIGYSVGRIYTSMSGFSARKGEAEAGEAAYSAVGEGVGHTQLVLLGRWLQMKGYAFWSMGHCYSPEMDYKRRLGHRVYPRADFLARNALYRGSLRHGVLAPGTWVELHGLKAKPELNGRTGVVVAGPESGGRICVRVGGSAGGSEDLRHPAAASEGGAEERGAVFQLKPENLGPVGTVGAAGVKFEPLGHGEECEFGRLISAGGAEK